jgi:transposase
MRPWRSWPSGSRALRAAMSTPRPSAAPSLTWIFHGKKKTLHATERDRPDVRRARRAFRRWIARIPRHRLVFVDEFGFNLAMTPGYARAPRGQRAYSDVPYNPGRNQTLTVGLRVTGTIAPFVVEGPTNSEVFTTYVATQLALLVRRGDIVLVDRAQAHVGAAARVALRARGARLELLPPYSPDFNPVEACGSKIKAFVRHAKPRSARELIDAIGRGWAAVTRGDARAWFKHYGYRGKCKRTPL